MFELMSLVRQSVKHGERQAFWVSKNTWNDKKAVYVPIWQASAALALVFRVLPETYCIKLSPKYVPL